MPKRTRSTYTQSLSAFSLNTSELIRLMRRKAHEDYKDIRSRIHEIDDLANMGINGYFTQRSVGEVREMLSANGYSLYGKINVDKEISDSPFDYSTLVITYEGSMTYRKMHMPHSDGGIAVLQPIHIKFTSQQNNFGGRFSKPLQRKYVNNSLITTIDIEKGEPEVISMRQDIPEDIYRKISEYLP
jgi:hypothetical protein